MPKSIVRSNLSRLSPLSIAAILIFAAAMTYLVFRAFAASGVANLYTSPAGTQSVTSGQSFAVNVRISTPANAPTVCAEVFLSYPSDKLQVTGQSYGGSAYSYEAIPAANSGGTLHMLRCSSPGTVVPGGDQLYAQVTFKAIATGSATVGFTDSSLVTSGEDNTNILSQRNGVTYNISAPATPPPSSGGGGSSGSTSSGSGGSTSKPSSGSAGSGSSSSQGGASGSSSTGSGSAQSPGTTSAPEGSDQTGSDTSSEGGIVEVTILDSDNNPVEGAEVTVDNQTVKTDKNGVAHFSNVASGEQTLSVSYNGKKTAKTVQVKSAAVQQSPQLFKVSITRNKFNPALLIIPALVLLAAGVFFIRPWDSKLTAKFANAQGGEVDIDKIVTSDRPAPIQSQPIIAPKPVPPAHSHSAEPPGTIYAPNGSGDKDNKPGSS